MDVKELASSESLMNLGKDKKKELVLWVAGVHRYMVPKGATSFESGEIFDLILFDGKKTFKKVLLHPSLNDMVTSGLLREKSLILATFSTSSFSEEADSSSSQQPLADRNARPYLHRNKFIDKNDFVLTNHLVVLDTEWHGGDKDSAFPSEAERRRLGESSPIVPNANYISNYNDNVIVWRFHKQEPLVPDEDTHIRALAGGMSIRDVAEKLFKDNGCKFQCTIVGRVVRKSCLLRFGDGKSVRNVCPFRSMYDVKDETGKVQVSFWGTRSMEAHATLKIGDLAYLKGVVHEYNGVLELKVSTPYGALRKFEMDEVPNEFSSSNSLISLNLCGSRNTYRFVPDTKSDSIPLDYCGVVSFCGPVRNVQNVDARSGGSNRIVQYRWLKIRDFISNHELCLKIYANCESNWDIDFRLDSVEIGMFILFTDLVILSVEEGNGSLRPRSMFARTTKHTNVIRCESLTQCQNLPFVRNLHLEHSMERYLDKSEDVEEEERKSTLIVPSSLDNARKIFFENMFVDLREEKDFDMHLRFKQSQVLVLRADVSEFSLDIKEDKAYVLFKLFTLLIGTKTTSTRSKSGTSLSSTKVNR